MGVMHYVTVVVCGSREDPGSSDLVEIDVFVQNSSKRYAIILGENNYQLTRRLTLAEQKIVNKTF